jgi:transcriptional regulator with XRE-family HTH domain
MPFDPLTLGNNISRRRENLGLSQRQLGLQCGVSQVTVHLWERGHAAPSLVRLALVADALGATVAELLDDKNGDANGAAA